MKCHSVTEPLNNILMNTHFAVYILLTVGVSSKPMFSSFTLGNFVLNLNFIKLCVNKINKKTFNKLSVVRISSILDLYSRKAQC